MIDLRNRMSDEWLNDLILCYIEKEIFRGLDGGEIRKTFQAFKNRTIDLPRPLEDLDTIKLDIFLVCMVFVELMGNYLQIRGTIINQCLNFP